MTDFNFQAYMLQMATCLNAIGHTEAAPKFFKVSGVAHLEEFLANLNKVRFPALIIEDNESGRFTDELSDNICDAPIYTFYVIKHIKNNDFEARTTAIAETKAVAKKIFGKMYQDKVKVLNGLMELDLGSVNYQTIGPIGDNCHGIMISFSVYNTAKIFFDENDDWTEV